MPSLPNTFVADISTNASTMIVNLSPTVTLILGVLLAALAVGILIHAVKK